MMKYLNIYKQEILKYWITIKIKILALICHYFKFTTKQRNTSQAFAECCIREFSGYIS